MSANSLSFFGGPLDGTRNMVAGDDFHKSYRYRKMKFRRVKPFDLAHGGGVAVQEAYVMISVDDVGLDPDMTMVEIAEFIDSNQGWNTLYVLNLDELAMETDNRFYLMKEVRSADGQSTRYRCA